MKSKARQPGDQVFPRPLVTVDVVIFTVRDGALSVLLVKRSADPYAGRWALPGGFIDIERDADLESAALRILREKTDARAPYLEQLGSFGDARRDPRGWAATHVFFALIPGDAIDPRPARDVEAIQWALVSEKGVKAALAFDHDRIVKAAVERLRGKAEYTALPVHLLPREFTVSDLQAMYEAVLGRALDKSAFRTRVLGADFLEPASGTRTGPNRPAQLYRLKKGREVVYFPRTFYGAKS